MRMINEFMKLALLHSNYSTSVADLYHFTLLEHIIDLCWKEIKRIDQSSKVKIQRLRYKTCSYGLVYRKGKQMLVTLVINKDCNKAD